MFSPPEPRNLFLELILVAHIFIKSAVAALSEDIYKQPHPHTNAALILYTLEHDVQCRLEQLIFPTLGSTIDIFRIPRPSEPTEVGRFLFMSLADDFD